MPRRVFVHIGAPKTGSTYVQNMLFDNAERLERIGIHLPVSFAAQDQAMTDLREVPWRDPQLYWTWDRMLERVTHCPGDVILTSEGFGGATAEQAKRAVDSLQPAEVHIVVAARDLWRTFPSMWQQSIRARSTWSFEEFLNLVENGRYEGFWEQYTANRMFFRWGDLVPAAQRHLITVPPAGAPQDLLWRRFAGVVGIPADLCEEVPPAANVSLGAPEIEVLRRVNGALGDLYPHRMPYQRVVQRHLIRAVLQQRANNVRFGVDLDRAGWVAELAEQQIKELRDYPCHTVGDLEDLRPAAMTGSRSPDDLTDRELLDTAIETIVGMISHADHLQQQLPQEVPGVLTKLQNRAGRVKRGLRRRILG